MNRNKGKCNTELLNSHTLDYSEAVGIPGRQFVNYTMGCLRSLVEGDTRAVEHKCNSFHV